MLYRKYITDYITARELERENDEKKYRNAKIDPSNTYIFLKLMPDFFFFTFKVKVSQIFTKLFVCSEGT